VITPLHITTVDALAGWPSCEKVVYENRPPGSYQELVRLQKRQSSTVQLMMRGRLRWRTGDSPSWNFVETGQALIYDAGIHGDLEYAGDHTGGHLEFIYVNLIGEAMRSAVLGIVERAGHAAAVHGGDELIKRWSAKLIGNNGAPSHRCMSAVESSELAWSFLHPLARGLAPTNGLAERAMAMLMDQWQHPPPLATLAKRLLVSREHLARVLRGTCGQPPGLWLRRYRLGRAADLLESGRPIPDVARSCGYCSAPHFIHAFRGEFGLTPGRWLRDKRNHGPPGPKPRSKDPGT
jgi:AraC-like DNA-binding protein